MPEKTSNLAPDLLDRCAIAYLALPLIIFLLGWFQVWIAAPLVACLTYALRHLIRKRNPATGFALTRLQFAVAVAVGCLWTVLGGTDHIFFANADWHVRDAVLHDLVTAHWPVSYGLLEGKESLLRAPVGFFLPAAVVGKLAGLASAHIAMLAWTAVGVSLFLMQMLSLTPSRAGVAVAVALVIVLFSGFDIIGNLLNDGPRFLVYWKPAKHLEWWAGTYQYSSMTTQLFWVPNHALGGWLIIGLLCRDTDKDMLLDSMLPIIMIMAALWSPLSAIGVAPFVLWKVVGSVLRHRRAGSLDPRAWLPALAVGLVVAAYLTLDSGSIPKGFSVGNQSSSGAVMDLLRHVQFFLLEAGIIGFMVLAIRRSTQVGLALVVLALLPFVYLGPFNDLVMRASIPALAVLAIGAAQALVCTPWNTANSGKRVLLGCMLGIGAVTPIQEIVRACTLASWPINFEATLIEANCGIYPPHYVAQLKNEVLSHLLRARYPLVSNPRNASACANPALFLMDKDGLLQW